MRACYYVCSAFLMLTIHTKQKKSKNQMDSNGLDFRPFLSIDITLFGINRKSFFYATFPSSSSSAHWLSCDFILIFGLF